MPRTLEQQLYYDSIAKNKPRINRIKRVAVVEPTTKEQYAKNCMYWVGEYLDGRRSEEQVKDSLQFLNEYIRQIIIERSKQKT